MISFDVSDDRLILMSHIMSETTPAYAGGDGVKITKLRDMCCGDSCNSTHLSLPNHIGSHVDAQKHFIKEGRAIDEYKISEWFFTSPFMVDMPVEPGQLLRANDFETALGNDKDINFLLIRTGMENMRHQDIFWKSAPGYHEELAEYLLGRFPGLKAIGMDSISLSSLHHREMGREAHRAFLGPDIRIFEDLALARVPQHRGLSAVIALPFLYEDADGAPCTIVGIKSGG